MTIALFLFRFCSGNWRRLFLYLHTLFRWDTQMTSNWFSWSTWLHHLIDVVGHYRLESCDTRLTFDKHGVQLWVLLLECAPERILLSLSKTWWHRCVSFHHVHGQSWLESRIQTRCLWFQVGLIQCLCRISFLLFWLVFVIEFKSDLLLLLIKYRLLHQCW